MKDKIISFSIVTVLGIIIGLLLYKPLFIKELPPTEPDIQTSTMTAVPDSFVYDTTYVHHYHTVYRDTGRVDTVKEFVESESPIGLRVERVISKKYIETFIHSDYVMSKVLIWTPMTASIDSVRDQVTVNFSKYVDDNIRPQFEDQLSETGTRMLIKGLVSGGIFGYAVSTKNPWLIGGSILADLGILIYF